MKYFLILFAILFSTPGFAKCAMNGIYMFSPTQTLNKNGVIILEFYGSSESLVPNLNKKYPVYLKSGHGKVALLVSEVLKGEFQITQVILKGASTLEENETYQLVIDNLPKYERAPEDFNEETKKWETVRIKVSGDIDNETPVFTGSITETRKSLIAYGCGPAKWVYFNISGQDKSALFVRATVKNKLTGKTTEYILPIENGTVKVGHGMCSGAFHFDNGVSYEVAFSLFDQSGNTSTPAEVIAFSSPTEATIEE